MENLNELVRALADRAAISDLLVRYMHGTDRNDWDVVASCFTQDASGSYAGNALGPGRDKLLAFMQEKMQADILGSTHMLGNVAITIDGDQAWVESYTVSYIASGEPGSKPTDLRVRGLRYMDDMIRTDHGWKIKRRTHTIDWQMDAVPSFALPRSERLYVGPTG